MSLGMIRGAVAAVVLGSGLGLGVATPAQAVQVDGIPDASWRVNGRVYATTTVGDTVFVGGTFTTATSPGGITAPRANLAAFSASTGELLTGWSADTNGAVRAIENVGTSLYVGGAFTTVNGLTKPKVAEVNTATGVVDTTFKARPNGTVLAIEADSSSVWLGGNFTATSGVATSRLSKVSAARGAVDPAFTASSSAWVYSLVQVKSVDRVNPVDTLYAGGNFTTMNGIARSGLAGVDAATGVLRPVVFASSGSAMDVDASDTRLYAGQVNNVAAAWDLATGKRLWARVADGNVQAIKRDPSDGMVYFGFHDGYLGDTSLKLLRTPDTGAVDPTFTPHFDRFYGVFDIALTSTRVVAGGEFTMVSGVPAQGWVRF